MRRPASLKPALLALCLAAWGSSYSVPVSNPNFDLNLPPALQDIETDLDFNQLFHWKSYTGSSARAHAWSHDSRYLAYIWNPYDVAGTDIWVHDRETGETFAITSLEKMHAFDADAPRMARRHRQDRAREAEWMQLEYREFREKRMEFRNQRQTDPIYSGPSDFTWANTSHEMIFVYRGDLYRWDADSREIDRLTITRDNISNPLYTKDDTGFYYRRGAGIYYSLFTSPMVRQLNPELPNNMSPGNMQLSPDGKWLMIQASRSTGQNRTVDYIVYRGRFAESRTVNRGVADDEFRTESFLWLYNLEEDPAFNPQGNGRLWELWRWPGGREWQQVSLNSNPWSEDGNYFVYATWRRDARELEIKVADLESREIIDLYKSTSEGEHNTPGIARPFFLADNRVVAMLDLSGFRHAHVLSMLTEGADQVTRGNFETYPLAAMKDGQSILVMSHREHPSRMDLYRVSVEDGAWTRLTSQRGNYGDPVVSPCERYAVSRFESWDVRPEAFLIDLNRPGNEVALTDSHRDGWNEIIKLQPELFEFQNRHGHTIHGFKFLPPDYQPGEERPLFVYVYGGPLTDRKSVVDGTFQTNAYLLNMYMTYVLGYITITIDPRGQSGYGNVFGGANWEAPGVAQTEDLVDAVSWVEETYGVDRSRVGLYGWSFGGFQTQHTMFTEPDVFTLGIAGAGPTEWQNYNTWYSGGVIGPSRPNQQPPDLDQFSLTHVAKNLKHPLMLVHGVEDTNVLYQDTIAVYRQLLQHGKGPLVELVIDPTGGHGLGGDIDRRDQQAIYLGFIMRHWGPFRSNLTAQD